MKRSKGFTLIELMVVIAVMAIVLSIVVPSAMRMLTSYRFSSMNRSFATAVLMARMRAIENRSVFAITSSSAGSTPTRTLFTTLADVPLRFRANTMATIPGNGDHVVITLYLADLLNLESPANNFTQINGVELEVQRCDVGANPPTFEVEYTWSGKNNTTGTVRNLTAPARLIVLPAAHSASPNWGIEPASAAYPGTYRNEEAFSGTGFSIREDGSDIIFCFDTDKYRVFFSADQTVVGDELDAAGTDPTAGGSAPFKFQQIIFDSHGLPENLAARTVLMCTTKDYPKGTTVTLDSSGTVRQIVTPTGRITTPMWK